MTQVRSVSIGVWLTRGSRHETAERGGIAHFVEHMLFKGTATRSRRGHRAGDRLDRRPARRVHRQGIRELLHQGARRAPAARHRHPLRHRPATRRSAPTTSSARRRSSLEEIKMVEDTPDDLVHELFTQGFWENHPLGRPILGTRETVESFNADLLRDYFRDAYTPREPDRLGRRQPRARARPRAGRARSSASLPSAGEPVDEEAPQVVPKILIRNKELEQSHLCLGVEQLSAESRRSLRELRAEHAARRLDELAAVSERAREARAGLRGVQRPERVSRRRLVHDLRRLRERSGRRGDRSRRRGAARREADAGAGRRAAAREGSPEGQPDAEPREHGEPHVASGAAGDLLRSAVRPRRDAAGHRAGDAGRRAARGRAICSGTARWRRPCSAT